MNKKLWLVSAIVSALSACADSPGRLPPVTDHSQQERSGQYRVGSASPTETEDAPVEDDDFFRKPAGGLQRGTDGQGVDVPSAKARRIEAQPLDETPATAAVGAADNALPANAAAEEGLPMESMDGAASDHGTVAMVTTPQTAIPESTLSAGTVNRAVENLVAKADQQTQRGELDGASHTVERALRMEPKNPYLWHRMASLRLKQGKNIQAEQTAQKSNSLASGDRELQSYNWRVIGAARRANGDSKGAKVAEDTARSLE